MADTSVKPEETHANGSVEPSKTEDDKVANGSEGENVEEPKVEEDNSTVTEVIEMDPEVRAKKIKRQIEYYFGDYNLPTDKFLKAEVKEKDGWIALETMLKFRRLKTLTEDPQVIVAALTNSDLVEINEEKTEVRRRPDKPLPEESEARRKEVLERSVYVKGFPTEGFTIDNALDFFEENGPTDDVVMRFFHDKADKSWKFKGSVFVKFPTKEAAAAFLALEEVKFGDTPLIRLWQEEYIEQKRKERLDQKLLKRKLPEDDGVKSKPEEPKGLPKNATLHMTKCPEGLKRELVKEKVEELGVTVAFIDFNKGDDEGWIRLHEADSAPTVMKQCGDDGVLKLAEGVEVELKALEGDEETKFLDSAQNSINERRAKGNHRQGGRGGRRGGRGGYRGRGGRWSSRKHDSEGEPHAKSLKTETCDDGD